LWYPVLWCLPCPSPICARQSLDLFTDLCEGPFLSSSGWFGPRGFELAAHVQGSGSFFATMTVQPSLLFFVPFFPQVSRTVVFRGCFRSVTPVWFVLGFLSAFFGPFSFRFCSGFFWRVGLFGLCLCSRVRGVQGFKACFFVWLPTCIVAPPLSLAGAWGCLFILDFCPFWVRLSF